MSSKTLSKMVRAADIAVAVCGLVVCCYILPTIGANIAREYPELSHCYLPWLIFLSAVSLPCFVILALVWQVSAAIKQEQVFTIQTARLVKTGFLLMFCDICFFFAGNVVFLLLSMSHPGIVLLSLFISVFGMALAVSAAILSRYLTKAVALQEEADTTI